MIKIDEELELTSFNPSDKANLLLYMNDPVLYANTLKVPSPYTEADADSWLELTEKECREFGHPHNWAIRSEAHGLIGGIGAFLSSGLEGHRDEIGYWLAAPFRGQGVMTKVLQAYTDYLFSSRPSLIRIEAKVYAHNPASGRILEKCGFEREGFARKLTLKNGNYIDTVLFALVK